MVLPRLYATYRGLSFENKRNTVTCESRLELSWLVMMVVVDVMNAFWTSVALITQGVGGSLTSQNYTVFNVSLVRVVGNLISGLCASSSLPET